MRGLSHSTIELILFAYAVLERLQPISLRHLHYAIFSAAKIDYQNTHREYRRLSRVTTAARRRYRMAQLNGTVAEYGIPDDWIIDEPRQGEKVSTWTGLGDYGETIKYGYRRENWQDQPVYVEVWSEKAAALASLRPVTRELGVMLRPCIGQGSAGMELQIGRLFEGVEKLIHILYLGDHDPSGHSIESSIHARAEVASGRKFQMRRLAIHARDIEDFHLPPQKIKETDVNTKKFKKRFGEQAPTVELEALPVEELRARVRKAIEDLIDFDRWNRHIAVEQVELQCVRRLAQQMQALSRRLEHENLDDFDNEPTASDDVELEDGEDEEIPTLSELGITEEEASRLSKLPRTVSVDWRLCEGAEILRTGAPDLFKQVGNGKMSVRKALHESKRRHQESAE